MTSLEHFPQPHNQQVFDQLHDIGAQDPVFGETGGLDGRSHPKS